MTRTINAALVAAVMATMGCGAGASDDPPPAAPVTGVISGDVYLVMQSGDVKRGAGQWLYLVPRGAPDSTVTAVCSRMHERIREAQQSRSAQDARRRAAAELFEPRIRALEDSMSRDITAARQRHRDLWEAQRAGEAAGARWLPRIKAVQDAADRFAAGPLVTADRIQLEAEAAVHLMVALIVAAADSTKASIDARYVFDSVPPGDYQVYGTTTIGSNRYAWWGPVTVRAGDTAVRDLDNEVEMADWLFSCRDDPVSGA